MDVDQLWTVVKENYIKKKNLDNSFDNTVYSRYLEPARLISADGQNYFLIVKTEVAKGIIKDSLPLLSDLIKEQTKLENSLAILKEDEIAKETPKPVKVSSESFDLSFENFVVGPSNRQAYQAALAISKNFGKMFNPLFIYANSGLGKTHLLKAISYEINRNHPNLKVLYLTSESFGNQVVEVLQKGYDEIEKFKEHLKSFDVLLIDDVQFLAKKEKTNEIFFSIFNHFVENNKQIVVTSDKSPEELNGFDQRMITRFNSGLTVKIEIPDSDTAVSIIQKELQNPDITLKLTRDAVSYLATYFASDVRKIKGSINQLIFFQMTNDYDIFTLEDVTELFKDIPSSGFGKINTMKIKEVVSEKYGISIKLIDGKTRTAEVIVARHVAMYLTKVILNKPLTQIGVDFGGKDHTTVMNAINKVERRMQKDKEFNKTIMKMKAAIIDK